MLVLEITHLKREGTIHYGLLHIYTAEGDCLKNVVWTFYQLVLIEQHIPHIKQTIGNVLALHLILITIPSFERMWKQQ